MVQGTDRNELVQRLRTARRTCKRNDLAAADGMSTVFKLGFAVPAGSQPSSLSLRCDAHFAIVTLGRAYRRERVEKLFFELLALCLNNIGRFVAKKSTAPRSIARIVTSASLVVVVLTMMTVARILLPSVTVPKAAVRPCGRCWRREQRHHSASS